MNLTLLSFYLTFLMSVCCQDYAGEARRGGAVSTRRRNYRGFALAFAGGAIAGGVTAHYLTKQQAKLQYGKERQDLLETVHLQDELSKIRDKQWEVEYKKLYDAYVQLDKDTVERDYEEFKAPDTNDDDMISRAEFNTYVRKYLSSFPELSEKDFPKFEEFDLDNNDGMVSFDEWQRFLKIQKANDAKEKNKNLAIGDGKKNTAYNELLEALYAENDNDDFGSGTYNGKNNKKGANGRSGSSYNRHDF